MLQCVQMERSYIEPAERRLVRQSPIHNRYDR